MQTKENLRTGSMMSLADSEREVQIENRQDDGTVWCMAVALSDKNVDPEIKLNGVDGKKMNLYRFYKMDRRERMNLEMEAKMQNCTVVCLPPGIKPKDLDVQGR